MLLSQVCDGDENEFERKKQEKCSLLGKIDCDEKIIILNNNEDYEGSQTLL